MFFLPSLQKPCDTSIEILSLSYIDGPSKMQNLVFPKNMHQKNKHTWANDTKAEMQGIVFLFKKFPFQQAKIQIH